MPPAPEALAEAQISAMVKAEEELTNAQTSNQINKGKPRNPTTRIDAIAATIIM